MYRECNDGSINEGRGGKKETKLNEKIGACEMPGDNAPINITHRAITFIYLYSPPERRGGEERGRGGGEERVEFYLRSIKLINNALSLPSPLLSSPLSSPLLSPLPPRTSLVAWKN